MQPTAPEIERRLQFVRELMTAEIPFNKVLGIEVLEVEPGRALFLVPFRKDLLGDAQRPALHGGVLSASADACGGAAVWTTIDPEDRISTIDLRVDYLRPARAEPIHIEGTVLRIGNRVGVAAIRVFHPDSPGETLADCKGVYSVRRAEDG